MTTISRPLRLAEAVGALSLATDLAMGQPLEHGLPTAVLAVRIARAMGVPTGDQVTARQVARRLGISPKTCDHRIQRLYGKTGVSTRAGATLFALEHGWSVPTRPPSDNGWLARNRSSMPE